MTTFAEVDPFFHPPRRPPEGTVVAVPARDLDAALDRVSRGAGSHSQRNGGRPHHRPTSPDAIRRRGRRG